MQETTGKYVLLKEETVLGLNEYVRLRREEYGVLLYWSVGFTSVDGDVINTSKSQSVPSSTAMMLALFDGKRPLKEIFQAVKYIWNKPSITFDGFCKGVEKFILLNVEPFQLEVPMLIEVTEEKKQKFMRYDPESFVIKGDKFSPPKITAAKFPISVNPMPSMDCVTDCVYCYMGRHIAPKYSSLPFARWKELLEEMAKYQLSELGFGGGDPMCYEHIIDMLKIASTFDPPTALNISTKTYISPEVAQRLARIPRLDFQISLDSTNLKIADAMVQRKGYGKQAMESIKNLMTAGLTPAVKAVVTPLNIHTVPQTILDLHNLEIQIIRVASYNRSVWHHKKELFNKVSEWKELKKRVDEIQGKYGFKIQMQGDTPQENPEPLKSFEERKKRWNERSGCTIGKKQVVILPDGSLIGCEQIPQIPEFFLGNVAHDSLYDVWNSEAFKKKAYNIPREKYKGTACYDCEEKEFKECHSASGKGYCMRESYKLFRTIYAPDPNCPYIDQKKFKLPRQQ